MYKVGLSTNGKILDEKLFIQYNKAGISAMEIALDSETLDRLDYDKVKEWADAYGITLWSLHLPFRPIEKSDLASQDENTRKTAIAYFTDIIKKGSKIGVKYFVVHPNSEEPIEMDDNRAVRMENVKVCLDALAEVADSVGSVIAVENLPRTCLARNSEELLELVSANDKLRVCYDTNHLMGQDAVEFIKAVGDKIVTLHVSDYDYMNERHWLPGEGKINWQDIYNTLKEVGYSGMWLYEIRFACPNTIIRERDLTCEDFMRNATEIFENKPLSVFSKQKENLGMWG